MGCVFCKIVAGEVDSSRFYEDDTVLGFMDIHPLRPGHVLIIPKTHAQHVADLHPDVAGELWGVGLRVAAAIRQALPCDDVHFLLNDGPAAFQTVHHVHLHVVPRSRGDTVGGVLRLFARPLTFLTRPAPRSRLDDQAERIRAAVAQPAPDP